MSYFEELKPKTGKPFYYKDNPEAVKARDSLRMWVEGKHISKKHPLYKPGRYKSFGHAAFVFVIGRALDTQFKRKRARLEVHGECQSQDHLKKLER